MGGSAMKMIGLAQKVMKAPSHLLWALYVWIVEGACEF